MATELGERPVSKQRADVAVAHIDAARHGKGLLHGVARFGAPHGDLRVSDPAAAENDAFAGVSQLDVEHRQQRRGRGAFQLGFDFDFGDERSIHHIGTSTADMAGWQEVTMLANAYLMVGNAAGPIVIATETGPATITAVDWQHVLIATGEFRQSIWLASFIVGAMRPIPMDFREDKYWQD